RGAVASLCFRRRLTLGAVDGGGGVGEAGADAVGGDDLAVALLSVIGVGVGLGADGAGDDDFLALAEGFCDVLGGLAPDHDVEGVGVVVVDVAAVAGAVLGVLDDAQVGDRSAGVGESQGGVLGEVPGDGDGAHVSPPSVPKVCQVAPFNVPDRHFVY